MKSSVIIVAGGVGSRMKCATPKQFLMLNEKPIARYSFELLLSLPQVTEVIVICDPQYRHYFDARSDKRVVFAMPGARRQDSVYNGLEKVDPTADFVCIHDAARPFIDQAAVERVFAAAEEYGAAALGMKVRFTIKECNAEDLVVNTPDRSFFWEIQTPQVVKYPLLKEGFAHADQKELTVTDDVSLVELLGAPVKLVEGLPLNIKITIPEDLAIAENWISRQNEPIHVNV